MKKTRVLLIALLLLSFVLAGCSKTTETKESKEEPKMMTTEFAQLEKLDLTEEWDKVFPKSDKVDHKKVTFINRYGITLAADMYTPKDAKGKLPAIAVSGPFGAVKEQSSGLYAQTMAERGFLTIAFDPSRSRKTLTPKRSASSASAAGAASPSTRRQPTPASKRRLPLPCMT